MTMRGRVTEAGWFLFEAVCLLTACLLVYQISDYVTGHETHEEFYTSLFIALYFSVAMRSKGCAL